MRDEHRDMANDDLPPAVAAAVDRLRDETAVAPEWRERVLRDVALHGRVRPRFRSGRVGVTAALALAASVSFVIIARARQGGQVPAVHFALLAPAASRVSLVGDFDGWNPGAVPMHRAADGATWVVDLPLRPGLHTFAYAVDGGIKIDPAAPRAAGDDFGTPSSVVVVSGPGGE